MDELIVTIVERLGYLGIAILMVLENVFPPMPSEAIMGAGALAVERGGMQFWPLLFAGTLGTVIGNLFWYEIGRRVGYNALRPVVDRFGRWLTIEWRDVEWLMAFFARHGHWIVFGLRTTPFMRTLISLPAGMAKMGLVKFLGFTAAGAAIWNTLLIIGTQWIARTFGSVDDIVSWIIIAIIVMSVGGYLFRLATWRPSGED